MENDKTNNSLIRTIRSIARAISLFITLFPIIFIVAEFFGENQKSESFQYFQILVGAMLMGGLMLAWKWERTGAIISLAGFIAVAFFNPDALKSYYFFIYPVTALMFLYCGFSSKLPKNQIPSA